MPLSRKVLIRVIGAPILLGILGAILYLDHRHQTMLGIVLLIVAVAVLSAVEFFKMAVARGIPVATIAGVCCVGFYLFPWERVIEIPIWMADWRVWVPTALLLYLLVKLVFRYATFTPEAAA